MAFVTRNGSVLLTSSEKCLKYALELKHKKALTNTFERKLDKNGKQKKLTKKQVAYRMSYLDKQKKADKALKTKRKTRKNKLYSN